MCKQDVIIVGGGSAGAVLAARLSADPQRKVLLLKWFDNGLENTKSTIRNP